MINYLRALYRRLSISDSTIPFAFLLAGFFAFGLSLPDLGYYMDDWSYVFYARLLGIDSLKDMLLYDLRPYAAWLYMLGFHVLGFRPVWWQLTILLLRWGAAVMMWLTLKQIWPARTHTLALIGLLFAVYPFFLFQPAALGSTHHWAGFLIFGLSLLLMVLAMQNTRYALVLSVSSLALEALHLFTSEYFGGLELLRPIILWIIIARREQTKTRVFNRVLFTWTPYLLLLLLFAVWRVAIFQNPAGVIRNEPVIVNQLLSQPLDALSFLILASLKDSVSVLTIGWQRAIDAGLLDFDNPYDRFRLAASAFFFFIAILYLNKLDTGSTHKQAEDGYRIGGLALALGALLVAGLPVWMVGRTIEVSKNLESATRVGIPAMFGAAFLIIFVIDGLITEKLKKVLAVSFLLALAVDFNMANTWGFRFSWEKQTRLYQELIWRAPSIEPGTAFITDEEILPYMGSYATSYAINTIYSPHGINSPPYWYFPVYYSYPNIDEFLEGIPIEYERYTLKFSGNSRDSLVIAFDPGLDRCLWVLRPSDVNLRLINSDLRMLSLVSSIDRISDNQGEEATLPEDLFGKGQKKGWCYYFEKGDLARQFSRWEQVVTLWQQAENQDIQPGNGYEYLPFIEGFGNAGEWGMVGKLTRSAQRITQGLEPSLCETLERLRFESPASAKRDEAIDELLEELRCREKG